MGSYWEDLEISVTNSNSFSLFQLHNINLFFLMRIIYIFDIIYGFKYPLMQVLIIACM